MTVIIYKKTLIVILIIIAIFVCSMSLYKNDEVALALNSKVNKKLPVYSVEDDTKVALPFDAAWGADKTEEILNTLNKFNVKGTFFLVGFWIDKYPSLVKKIYDLGFDIGNHSITHLDMTKLNESQRINEINLTNEKIKNITGESPKFFRFPYGAYNLDSVLSVEKQGMIPIQWDVDSLDWKGLNETEILKRIQDKVKGGSIILFHNNSEHVLDALPLVVDYLLSKNYELVPLSQLVYEDNYIIDINGVQHRNVI